MTEENALSEFVINRSDELNEPVVKASQEPPARIPADRKSFLHQLTAWAFRPGIRQVTVVLVDQGFSSITNFMTGVLVARACSKAEYGLYVLGFTLLITMMGIQAGLSGTPFTVLSPRMKPYSRRLYLGSTIIQHLVVSALAAVGFVLAGAVVLVTGSKDGFAEVLFALAAVSVFVLLRDFVRYVLLAQLRVWASLLMGLASNGPTVGFLLWAYFARWLSPTTAYLIMAGCSGLPVLFILLAERKQIGFAANKLPQHIRENLRFGKWLVARTAVSLFAVQLYPWVLAIFKGVPAAAVYGACIGLVSMVNPLFMGINRYLGPKAAHAACHGSPAVRRVVNRTIIVLAGPLVVFILATLFFGDWILAKLYGGAYAEAGYVLAICVFAMSITAIGSPVDPGINAIGRPDLGFRARLLGAGVSVVIGIPLIFIYGPAGAAFGLMLSNAFSVAYWYLRFVALTRPAKATQADDSWSYFSGDKYKRAGCAAAGVNKMTDIK